MVPLVMVLGGGDRVWLWRCDVMCGSGVCRWCVLVWYILVEVVECWWFAACDVDAGVCCCSVTWVYRCGAVHRTEG